MIINPYTPPQPGPAAVRAMQRLGRQIAENRLAIMQKPLRASRQAQRSYNRAHFKAMASPRPGIRAAKRALLGFEPGLGKRAVPVHTGHPFTS